MKEKTRKERMKEFVVYHNEGDGECNNIILKRYAEKNGLTSEKRFALSYYFATTYCVPAAIYMLKQDDYIKKQPREWARQNKDGIIFQSDRKYVRMQDHFENLLAEYSEKGPQMVEGLERCIPDGRLNLEAAIRFVENWYFFGRFAAYLFLETWAEMIGIEVSNTFIDWPNGDTATSGLLNLFCYDAEAALFDKTGQLALPEKQMDKMLTILTNTIERSGGDANVTKVETTLCAYRKLYKGTRYNGYYLDRMLEELAFYENNKPEYRQIVKEIKDIRKAEYKAKYLGEVMGWQGVRKECKKIYKETGKML